MALSSPEGKVSSSPLSLDMSSGKAKNLIQPVMEPTVSWMMVRRGGWPFIGGVGRRRSATGNMIRETWAIQNCMYWAWQGCMPVQMKIWIGVAHYLQGIAALLRHEQTAIGCQGRLGSEDWSLDEPFETS
jgi:hypothetical protein